MRITSTLLSIIHITLFTMIFSIGVFFLLLPWLPKFCYLFAQTLLQEPYLFFTIGMSIIFFTLILFLGVVSFHHAKYLQVNMDRFFCETDLSVIEGYLQKYWKEKFSEKEIQTSVELTADQKLEIFVQMPNIEKKEQKLLLKRSEREVGKLLREQFQYKKDFIFTLLFY